MVKKKGEPDTCSATNYTKRDIRASMCSILKCILPRQRETSRGSGRRNLEFNSRSYHQARCPPFHLLLQPQVLIAANLVLLKSIAASSLGACLSLAPQICTHILPVVKFPFLYTYQTLVFRTRKYRNRFSDSVDCLNRVEDVRPQAYLEP